MSLVKSAQVDFGIRTPGTWNPGEIDASITLSAGNMVATCGAAGDRGVASWLLRTTGKWYFEFRLGAAWSGGDTGLGAIKQGSSKPNFGSSGTLGLAIFPSAAMWNGSSLGASGVTPGANTTVGMAVDLTNNLGWFTTDGSTWSFTGNPAAGTNGKTGGWSTGDKVVPAVCFGANALVCTLRLHAPDFTLAIPSGFLPWEP